MTNRYSPLPPPNGEQYAYRELLDFSRAIAEPQDSVPLQVLASEPAKPRDGMVAHADGTNWNPGAGAGPYAYIGSTWTPLFTGGAGTVADGDKGDISISSGVWNIDAATVGLTELSASATASASVFLRGDNKWSRIDTTDDVIIDLATKGLVLKDTQGTPHYWRITISNTGALVTTDLGTTKP